jgi:hypothetical protein
MSASRIFPAAGLVLAVSLPSPALARLGLARLDDNSSTPDLPGWLVVGCAALVCVAILWVYLRRYCGWTVDGQW